MEKILSLLKSKKFWTLIASLVAALSAFFLTSCTGFMKLQRSGVHHDTVRYEQVIKAKSYQSSLFTCSQKKSTPILNIGRSTKLSGQCIACAPIIKQTKVISLGYLCTPVPISLKSLNRSSISMLISPTASVATYSVLPRFIPLRSTRINYSDLSFAMMSIPVSLEFKRGGRRGRPRPRPSTKSVPLGGSHL